MLEKMISQNRVMTWSRWLLTLCLLGFFNGSAFAQGTFQLLVQRGPYYVGEPVVVQVAAKFTDDSGIKPDCRLVGDAQVGLQVSGPRVSQSISRYMQSSGGRTTSQEISNFKFTFAAIASKAGRFSIGPFEVDYGGNKKTVEGTTVEFEQLDNDEDMLLEVSMPGDTFFVGQRVPVTIKWGCSAPIYDVQFAFQNLQIQSPLFDQFSFDDKEARTQTSLTIRSATGEEVSIDAKQSTEMRGGREFVVLTSQRTMIVDAVGDFEMLPITCHTKRGSGWRKDLFGRARPSSTRPAFTSGEPVDFTVKTLPTEGRPDSFAGAVGDGYAIDVSANRSVVRVGDPISLTVDLRGPGLERMSLPDLSKDGGMDPQLFQIPKEQPSGTYNGQTKQFKVSVRVKDESVQQFPALAFSWFDPYKAQYFTTRSKPIALQVMPAQVVSATDVIAAASARQGSAVAGSGSNSAGNASNNAPTSSVSLLAQGANLAIEQDPNKLLARSTNAFFGKLISWGSYGLGLAAIATALLVRRRGDVDPEVAQQRQRRRAWRKQISDAGDLSGKAAAEQIAGGLRQLQATVDAVDRAKLNELIRECENAIYAPSEANADTRDLVNRALHVVDSIKAAD